jgi:hypothetical protein
MEWTRTDTIALAKSSCAQCHGLGIKWGQPDDKVAPCHCVLRNVFRICYNRFRYCVTKEKYMSHVSLEYTSGREGLRSWGRKDEEYVADFVLVSKRHLTEDEYRVFNYHFLLGADWKLCCRRLGLERGRFFHQVYGIQQKLGRVFKDLQPYALYPLDQYFNAPKKERMLPQRTIMRKVIPIRPTLAGQQTAQPQDQPVRKSA